MDGRRKPVRSRWRSTVGWKIIAGEWWPVARSWRRHIGGSAEIRKCQRDEQNCERNNRNGKIAHGTLPSILAINLNTAERLKGFLSTEKGDTLQKFAE
jgi:hypothetical protein